jgi:hypothetical protein
MENHMKKMLVLFLIGSLLTSCVSVEQEVQRRVEQTQKAAGLILTRSAAPTNTATSTLAQPTATASLVHTTPTPMENTPTVTTTVLPSTSGPTATLAPDSWTSMPVLPDHISDKMVSIYQLGQMMGNDPQAFSKVGDCQSTLPSFLGDFDKGNYVLGDQYNYLEPTIQYFSGSFNRNSRAAKDGMSAAGTMATLWNVWKDCESYETPLDCEYRLNKPSFAFISLGTNDAYGFASLDVTLRRVIDVTIGHGIVPVLVTKADNAEGNNRNNEIISRIAYEYEIPLWNFWLSVQPLPEHGLRSKEHLTFGEFTSPFDFSKPDNLLYAWNVRNLTALQVLDMLRQWALKQKSS